MAEQAVDLRSAFSVLKRRKRVLMWAALVGAGAGVALGVVQPPQYVSQTEVLLPPGKGLDGQPAARDADTEVRIVSSDVVMQPAGQATSPALSLAEVAERVDVSATTDDVIEIRASGPTAEQARALAQAMGNATVAYVDSARNTLSGAQRAVLADRRRDLQASLRSVNLEMRKTQARLDGDGGDTNEPGSRADAAALAQLTAQQSSLLLQLDDVKDSTEQAMAGSAATVIERATPPTRPGLVRLVLVSAGSGLVASVVLLALLLTLFAKRDKRLRYRDDMADAIGSRVVASVRTEAGRNAAGWTSVFERYSPRDSDAWALRQILHQVVLHERSFDFEPDRPLEPEDFSQSTSILVVSIAGDQRGLAVGPQLASYTASLGVATRLIAGQAHESAAALWAACSHARAHDQARPHLSVATSAETGGGDFTVVLAVVDRTTPVLHHELPRTTATVLSVAAGTATADELARVAVAADEDNRKFDGIVVADRDDLDPTTGRLLRSERWREVPLPTLLTGTDGLDADEPPEENTRGGVA
ncbi:MAG TPA: Wzz/FepE/Etk N-terminal domain-containing protein [Intrasporangium sp.]|nr:Wzz/FepE/Etk N-terminal domain-containing protein [Intrasporangium sp.]